MNRRTFLCGLTLGALAAPLAAKAQQAGKVYRIGFFRSGHPPEGYIEGLQQGLREQGYVPGQNVVIELRATDGSADPLPGLAEELVRSRVDVVLASAALAALAVKRTTVSVPVVFVGVFDPVGLGLVSSLARPGGNVTGLAANAADLAGKRLELLRVIVPRLRRVALLSHPANPTNSIQLKGAQAAARTLGVQLELVTIQGGEFRRAGQGGSRRRRSLAARESLVRDVPRSTRRAGSPEPTARDLQPERVRRSRRAHIIWHGLSRPIPARGPIRGQDLERRQAG